ncbi:MAG: hypothetical protein Q7V63_06925 [Gammaproteobacteria bacterium]|nr:hypothetical protein [Gammaproteobacteria bacterium]
MAKVIAEQVFWKEVCTQVHALNPQLANAIESIKDADKKTLIKVRYKFGDLILNSGAVQLPVETGDCLPLSHPDCKRFSIALSYAPVPLGLILRQGVEIFVDSSNYITPLNLLKPGNLFGLFEVLDSAANNPVAPVWSITAGARSTFFLPKISDRQGHERLKRSFNVPADPPRKLSEQWNVFKAIAQSPELKLEWYCEVLFFTRDWFTDFTDKSSFKAYLNELAWQQSRYARQHIILSLLWKSLAVEINRRNLRTRAYIIDTLKHLIGVASKSVPAFNVVTDDVLIPLQEIQQAYIDQYLLKEYLPTMMAPATLGSNSEYNKVYYSLSKPTLVEGAPDERDNTPSILTDMREIKSVYDLFKKSSHLDGLKVSAENMNCKFYHIEPSQMDSIHSSSLLAKENPLFLMDAKRFKGREFCASASFLRGCIEIS